MSSLRCLMASWTFSFTMAVTMLKVLLCCETLCLGIPSVFSSKGHFNIVSVKGHFNIACSHLRKKKRFQLRNYPDQIGLHRYCMAVGDLIVNWCRRVQSTVGDTIPRQVVWRYKRKLGKHDLSVHTPRMEAQLHNELQKAFSVVSNNGNRKHTLLFKSHFSRKKWG